MKHRNRQVYREMEDWIDKASRLMIDAADQLERQELELKVLRRENDKMQTLLANYRQLQYDDQEKIGELLLELHDLQAELADVEDGITRYDPTDVPFA